MATTYDGATVEILNWDEFNGRKDIKEPTWFRVENSLPFSESLHGLDPDEKWVWVVLLCVASKKNSQTFTLNVGYLAHSSGVKLSRVESALEKLEKNGTISVRVQIRTDPYGSDRTRTDLALTDTTDRQTDTTNKQTNKLVATFDFEALYQKYPRKLGRQEGIKRCRAQIKTHDEFEDLSRAIDRYKAHLKEKGTEEKYIKHFSTFMSSWRDWLRSDAGSAEAVSAHHSNPAYRRMAGNQAALNEYLNSLPGAADGQAS